ncbi:VanZ family protein [Cellulosimicrobium sp. 22601]|uniref:VanZ family protein n=1 Tax=unclassified Cellulosimicrobium TaxID=2624466 RepID=UPI003F82A67C
MAAHDPHADPGLVEDEDRAADSGGPAPARPARTAERVVLGLYVLVLVWVVLLKIHTGDLGDLVGRRSVNLVPMGGTASGGLGSRELAVNVLVFVPLGVLVLLAARQRRFARMLLLVVGVSVVFEVVQYVAGIGASDVTDVLTNTAGGLVGMGLAWLGLRVLGDHARRRVLVALVVVLVALAAGFFTWLGVTGVRFRL